MSAKDPGPEPDREAEQASGNGTRAKRRERKAAREAEMRGWTNKCPRHSGELGRDRAAKLGTDAATERATVLHVQVRRLRLLRLSSG
ncbi:hypothetical protein GCM10022207_75210 [Streptomyces lannensis]|uniref:Uncharacterized protein n=1 Tax=Streptomyces lannensis TaxID=766498 RepID=A0ABP7L8N0_9ACTN